MRKIILSEGEYYHVCSRGVAKQTLFHDKKDYWRFLFLVLYFQSTITFEKVGREVEKFVRHRMLDSIVANDIVKKRQVELVCFCIMPNHFHLLIKEVEEGGISKYMQRILNSYAKYYNTKYEKSGHVFQGKFRAVHVENNEQILYLSAYIHRNPRELIPRENEEEYYWSSFRDYITQNRWERIANPEIIIDQFKSKEEYTKFVLSSTSKILKEELEHITLE